MNKHKIICGTKIKSKPTEQEMLNEILKQIREISEIIKQMNGDKNDKR